MSGNTTLLLTKERGNFFFGFHDLVAWNAKGTRLAVLRIEEMDTPPQPGVPCEIGFVENNVFHKLGTTFAYNYPQGARQQWIGKSNLLIVNDRVGDVWGSRVYDTDTKQLAAELGYTAHVITDDGWAFGIDYARLHRVGGYGYAGLKDQTGNSHAPGNAGIVKHNVFTKAHELLISIKDIAAHQSGGNIGKHNYVTHLVLNPSQTRIAFLHRYKLKDGGETTRLMTIGTDGKDLRCLGTGFLSHFDWKDDNSIAIWGRTGSGIEKLRESFLYKMIPTGLISWLKKMIKRFVYKPKPSATGASLFNWLVFTDEGTSKQSLLAKDIIVEDGHPMFSPANRDWMVCDNYPDGNGVRTLFLFQISTQKKIDLGQYRMVDDKPDLSRLGEALADVEPSVLKAFELKNIAFYRSGFHCDLHPRWNASGTMIAFDSIHEGRRAIYGFDVSAYTT